MNTHFLNKIKRNINIKIFINYCNKFYINYYLMDYNKDSLAKDKAQTWKTFNKLTIYTIIFVAIILFIIFTLFSY